MKEEKSKLEQWFDAEGAIRENITLDELEHDLCRISRLETGLPMNIWVNHGYCDWIGDNVLYFESGYKDSKGAFQATAFLIRQGKSWSECRGIQDDVKVLTRWVKENGEALIKVARGEMKFQAFLDSRKVGAFLREAKRLGALDDLIKKEMSKPLEPETTHLSMTIYVDNDASKHTKMVLEYNSQPPKIDPDTKNSPSPSSRLNKVCNGKRGLVVISFAVDSDTDEIHCTNVTFKRVSQDTELSKEDGKKLVEWIHRNIKGLHIVKYTNPKFDNWI